MKERLLRSRYVFGETAVFKFIEKIKGETASLSGSAEAIKIEEKRAQYKKQMDVLRDQETDDIIAGKKAEYKQLQAQFIVVGKKYSNRKDCNGH